MQSGQHRHFVPERQDVEGHVDEGAFGRRHPGLFLGGLALRGLSPGWALAGVLGLVPGTLVPGWFSLRRIRICAEIAT